MHLIKELKNQKKTYLLIALFLIGIINFAVLIINNNVNAYCYTCSNGCGTSCVPDGGGLCLNANCVYPGNCFSTFGATNCGGGVYVCGSCPGTPPPGTPPGTQTPPPSSGGGGGCPGLCWLYGEQGYTLDGQPAVGGDPNAACPGNTWTGSKGWCSPVGSGTCTPRINPWSFSCRQCNVGGNGNKDTIGNYPCGMGGAIYYGRAYCVGSGGQVYPIPGATIRYYNAQRNYTEAPASSNRWQELNGTGGTTNSQGYFEIYAMGGANDNIDITLPAGNLAGTGKPLTQLGRNPANCNNAAATGCQAASCGNNFSYNCTISKSSGATYPANQAQVNSQPGIPKIYNVNFIYTNCEICNPTNPTAVAQTSPANGSTVPNPTSVTLAWNNTAFGVGCPSNNNFYRTYISTSASGPWTLAYEGSGNSVNVGGLGNNTTYYWFVWKTNGSNSVQTPVWSFKTNAWPTMAYNGQLAADVCGTGFSGRAAAASNITNPIRLRVTMTDLNSDTANAIHLALVPRSASGGAAIYPNANVSANVGTWSSFYIAMGYGSGTYWASQYHPSTNWTGAGVGVSEFSVGNGKATVLDIGNTTTGTSGSSSGQTTVATFQVRLENTFGSTVSNPTGIWDIYTIGVTQNSDGNNYPTNGTWDWRRMGDWRVDLQSPSASISGPTYNADGSYTMVFNGFDNLGILRVPNYITTLESAPSLYDNTVGQNITFGTPPSSTTWPPNGFYYDYSGTTRPSSFNVTRSYTDNSTSPGVQYSYLYQVIDQGCNQSNITTTATEPTPWMLVTGGNASVNGSTMFDTTQKNINIPDVVSSNVAIGKTASQSSTYPGGDAIDAIDGNVDGNWGSGSVTHTLNDAQAWWHVDLGDIYNISDIKIFNRTDAATDRLSNFYVFVSDVPFSSTNLTTTINQSGVSNHYTAGVADTITTKNINRTGRYIRVQLSGTNNLSLGEVQVFASQPFSITGLSGYAYNDGAAGPFFTTYSSMSGTAQTIVKPNSNISKLNRFVTGYNNEGATPPIGTSWYEYLKNIVTRNAVTASVNFSTNNEGVIGIPQFPMGQQYNGSLASTFGITAGSKRVVYATGNIWLMPGSVCDIQSIIFVDGNLRIAPSITRNSGSLCVFVVKGNISIGTGSNGSPIGLATSTQPYYDIVSASLIADEYIWIDNNSMGAANKGEGVYIRGSVVSGGNFEWNRDLNSQANAFHPAIVINTEPNFYTTFREDLRVKDYSIKEQQ